MAQKDIGQHTIKVLTDKVIKAKPGTDRHRTWSVLIKMNGKTVSEYYKEANKVRKGSSKTARNNVMDAVTKKLIELNAPKQETPKKVTATKKVSEKVVSLH